MTDAAAAAQNALGDRTVRTSIIPFDDDNFSGVSNTTTVDLGIATFKNIFGYRYSGVSNEEDDAGLPATGLPNIGLGALGVVPGQPGILIATKNVSISEQITDEVQFAGTALNDAFSWLLGGFYLDEHPAGQNYLTLDLFRPTPPTATTSFIVNNFLGGIWPVGSQDDTLYGDASRAVFGNVSYDLGQLGSWAEGLKLNAGYRYTWDREQFCGNGRASVSLATGQTVAPPYSGVEQCSQDHGSAYGPLSFDSSAAFKAPTYTFGVDYKLSDNEFLYFTTRRGYRAGGLNAPQLAPSLSGFQDFKPQTVTDYEIGSHTQLKFNEWITRFNIAAFTGDFSQIQQQASGITAASGIPGVTGANQPSNTSLELNVGTVTAEGVEFDGLISPFRGLNFTFGGAYLYEKYDSLDVPQILAPFFTASGFTGAPRWSYQAGLTYVLPLNPDIGAIALHGDFYNIGKEFQGPVLLNEYSLTNLNVQWSEIYGKPIDLTLYVDNVTDTKYIQDIILSTPSFGVYSGGYGAPRMWGARLRYNF
jgi:iron complex outermembrane receptor protein